MAKHGRLIKFSKGQVVQTVEGQRNLNLVKSGFIKRYLINNDGSLSVDVIYGPQDVFSLTLIFRALYEREILESPEVYYYEAMGNAELYCLNIDDFTAALESNPLLYKDLYNEAGKRMTYLTHGLENISMKNSYRRVAHRLAFYAHHFGHRERGGTRILVPLTHQDIADILSLTRETVSVCMMKLRAKKLIKTNRQITVTNVEKLSEEAFSEE